MNSETVHFEIKNGYIAVARLLEKTRASGNSDLLQKVKLFEKQLDYSKITGKVN